MSLYRSRTLILTVSMIACMHTQVFACEDTVNDVRNRLNFGAELSEITSAELECLEEIVESFSDADLSNKKKLMEASGASSILKEVNKTNKLWKYKRDYDLYFCFDNTTNAIEARKLIWQLRGILREDGLGPSDKEYIEAWANKCEYGQVMLDLLEHYKHRLLSENYVNTFLEIIEEDQVEYDYMYMGGAYPSSYFILQYFEFLRNVAGSGYAITRSQAVMLTRNLLQKHSDIFDYNTNYFRKYPNPSRDAEAEGAFISLLRIINHHELKDELESLAKSQKENESLILSLGNYVKIEEVKTFLSKMELLKTQ